MYAVTKTYGHELGLSACFRQWRANSHCRHLHGYALSFKLEFRAPTLNENNWVIDFGSLKPIKKFLEETFDHRLAIAADDPALTTIRVMANTFDNANIIVLPKVGCEAFAYLVFMHVSSWLDETDDGKRGVTLHSVECREHGANSAIFFGD